MLLRKYLVGGKIVSISNYDLERTVEIQFECYNDLNDLVKRKLFIEIMSRQSNIILTNENNIIIDTLKHFDNVRELLPAHEYTYPPINKISFIELQNFENFKKMLISNGESLTKFLVNTFIGFSKSFVKETLKLLNISDLEYTNQDLEKLFNYINKLINSIGTAEIYCKQISEKDYTIVLNDFLEIEDVKDNNKKLYINNFIDEFYYKKETTNIFTTSRNNLLKVVSNSLKKVYKKLENINQKLKECNQMDTFRLYGELLTANLYKLNPNDNISEYTLENYNKVIYLCNQALDIKTNEKTYINEKISYDHTIYDLLSMCYYYKNEKQLALYYIDKAIKQSPNIKRLQDNKKYFSKMKD